MSSLPVHIKVKMSGKAIAAAVADPAAPQIVGGDGADSLVTVTNVPVLETGVEYPASTGPFTVTQEMLEEAVAAQDDPHIKAPRVKLGHFEDGESAVNDDLQELFDKSRDGSDPSVGTWQDLRLSDDGQVLIADLTGVPRWFAEIMASAYPARSIEGGTWRNSANNKEYSFCIEAVVLLGVVWPGCTSLDDLRDLFSEEGPDDVQVIEMNRKVGEGMTPKAQVNIEDVRRAFYEDVAVDDRFWWWDRATLLQPNEMIVQDPDSGQLYRLPFTVNNDEVSFSDPVAVKVVYEDVPEKDDKTKASIQLAALPNAGNIVHSNKTRAAAYEGYRERHDESEDQMDPKEIRKRLGLPEDATDEEVYAKLDATASAADEGDEGGTESAGSEGEPNTPAEGNQGDAGRAPEPVAAAADGTATIDRETLASLQAQAAAGAQAAERQRVEDRDRFLTEQGVKAGRFAPARLEHWKNLWDKDPEGTKATIEGLEKGLIPVATHGTEHNGDAPQAQAGYDDSRLTPSERARIKAAREGQEAPRVMIGKD